MARRVEGLLQRDARVGTGERAQLVLERDQPLVDEHRDDRDGFDDRAPPDFGDPRSLRNWSASGSRSRLNASVTPNWLSTPCARGGELVANPGGAADRFRIATPSRARPPLSADRSRQATPRPAQHPVHEADTSRPSVGHFEASMRICRRIDRADTAVRQTLTSSIVPLNHSPRTWFPPIVSGPRPELIAP